MDRVTSDDGLGSANTAHFRLYMYECTAGLGLKRTFEIHLQCKVPAIQLQNDYTM